MAILKNKRYAKYTSKYASASVNQRSPFKLVDPYESTLAKTWALHFLLNRPEHQHCFYFLMKFYIIIKYLGTFSHSICWVNGIVLML